MVIAVVVAPLFVVLLHPFFPLFVILLGWVVGMTMAITAARGSLVMAAIKMRVAAVITGESLAMAWVLPTVLIVLPGIMLVVLLSGCMTLMITAPLINLFVLPL